MPYTRNYCSGTFTKTFTSNLMEVNAARICGATISKFTSSFVGGLGNQCCRSRVKNFRRRGRALTCSQLPPADLRSKSALLDTPWRSSRKRMRKLTSSVMQSVGTSRTDAGLTLPYNFHIAIETLIYSDRAE